MGADDLIVHGGGQPPAAAAWSTTQLDHRIAMASWSWASPRASRCGRRRPPIATSFPGFAALMNGLGRQDRGRRESAGVTAPLVIAVDGPGRSGKGTLARRLAAHFGLPHLDTGLLYRAVGWPCSTADRPAAARGGRGRRCSARRPRRSRRLRGDEAGQAASMVGGDPGGAGRPVAFQTDFASQAAGRGARRARHRHGRSAPTRRSSCSSPPAPEARRRAPVRGVAGAGASTLYSRAFLPRWRSVTAATANGRLRPWAAPDAWLLDTTTSMPMRPSRPRWRSSSARAFEPPGRKSPPADRRLPAAIANGRASGVGVCKALDPPDLTGWPTGGSVSPGIDEGEVLNGQGQRPA